MKKSKINLIYILGTSYSGSSILGIVLGANKKVFNAGELKFYNRLIKKGGELCSCGKNCLDCSFWEEIFQKQYKVFGKPTYTQKISFILQILSGRKLKFNEKYDDYKLLKSIYSKAKKSNPSTKYIIDTSKSLWRLAYLINDKNINIKVIYLKRDIYGNVASFMKHGKSFYKGLLIYLLNNFVIRRFLSYNKKINSIEVIYEKLCKKTVNELNLLGDFLNLKYDDYVKMVRNAKDVLHIPSGNKGTRKQFLKGFKGIRYDNSWKERLRPWQKSLLLMLKA
jgi:hypothetical protein